MESKGKDVVSTRVFAKGELLCEYFGQHIPFSEAKRREKEYSLDPTVGSYMFYYQHKGKRQWYMFSFSVLSSGLTPSVIFTASSDHSVDATKDAGRLGRFFNHSKKSPNVVPKLVELEDQVHLCLFAARDI